MSVKLNIKANVTGTNQVKDLNSALKDTLKNSKGASRGLKDLDKAAKKGRASFSALGSVLKTGVVAGLAGVTVGIGKFVKDTFEAGKLTQQLQVRFKLLFNSAEEGSKAFQKLNEFAGKVPFSLEAIAQGSGNLAVISEDADDLARILEVTGNVAAATGLDFAQTATQIQRSFAGGIASADIFRERGVRAMLGFEAGAKVSIEETRKRFFEVFANGGQYSRATADFEQTLEAQVSFVQDAYFRFRQAASAPLFEGVTKQVKELVGDFKKNDEQLNALAKRFGKGLASGFETVGNVIKVLVRNFDLLVTSFKVIVGLKIASTFVNMGAAIASTAIGFKRAATAAGLLNTVVKANPIGVLITAIQAGVTVFILFEKQIMSVVDKIQNYFVRQTKIAAKAVLELISKIKIFPKQAAAAAEGAKQIGEELEQMKFEATDAYKELERLSKIPKFADNGTFAPDIMGKATARAKKQAEELAKARETRTGDLEEITSKRLYQMDVQRILAQRKLNNNVKSYKDILNDVGITSKDIAGTISDTWLNGIRESNSLLDITKNTFRNVLTSISETLVKKSAELMIERLFDQLGQKKIQNEKMLNAERTRGNSLLSKAGSLFSSGLGSFFSGGSSGGGSFFNTAFNFGKKILGFNKGGIVPGGAPYTDRVPAMLTPGEVVVPRNKVDTMNQGSTNITNINISGNVDQRSIDQIKAVIAQSSAEVGGANRSYQRNTAGIRGRFR